MRVTNQAAAAAVQRSLQNNYAELSKLQQQAADGRRITRSADDPAATAQVMGVRAEMAAQKQHAGNIADATGWLNTLDSSLSQITEMLQRVRDLSVQGFSQNTSAAAREAIAVEVDAIKDGLLRQANTSHMGRTVYAGTSDAPAVFDEATYTYTGVPGAEVTRQVAPGQTVRVDADARSVFGEGDASAFALLDSIAAELRTGVHRPARIDDVDVALDRVLQTHTTVGARQVQLERAADADLASHNDLESRRSALEDADLAELVIDLQLKELAYQSSLQIGARVLQPTLMDFI